MSKTVILKIEVDDDVVLGFDAHQALPLPIPADDTYVVNDITCIPITR